MMQNVLDLERHVDLGVARNTPITGVRVVGGSAYASVNSLSDINRAVPEIKQFSIRAIWTIDRYTHV